MGYASFSMALARLLNFRQQLIEGSGRQQVTLHLHKGRPELRIFVESRDAQRGLPSADIEHQVVAYLYVVQSALRNADIGLAVRRPSLIVAIRREVIGEDVEVEG